jgi:hypothetical protein
LRSGERDIRHDQAPLRGDVDEAWTSYRLAQQFALSGINAMFIAPEAPSAKWRPIAWPSLTDLLRTVADEIDVAMPAQRLVVAGHSGAYRTLALWLANRMLDTVVLLDALYVESGLLPWVRASRQRRLVNIVYETGRVSGYLHRRLPSTKWISGLPLDGIPDARIVYVKTDVGHWQLVTDGVALPLALRAIAVPLVASAPVDLQAGLPPTANPRRSPGKKWRPMRASRAITCTRLVSTELAACLRWLAYLRSSGRGRDLAVPDAAASPHDGGLPDAPLQWPGGLSHLGLRPQHMILACALPVVCFIIILNRDSGMRG